MRSETFETPGPLRLVVRIPAGVIDVETVASSRTYVELEAIDGDADIVDAATVSLRDRGDGHELTIAFEQERRILFVKTAPRVRATVRCPEGTELAVQAVSADLRARGTFASAEVKTVSGDVNVGRVDGEAAVKTVSGGATIGEVGGRGAFQTVSGDFEIARVGGEAELRTVSGDVRVGEAGGSVTGQTVSGDVRVDAAAQGSVTLKSVSGDLLVGIRRGTKLWVDARSMSGDMSSELEVGDTPPSGDGPLVELRATAMSGDIRIARA